MASATVGQLYEILGVLANRMPSKMESLDKERLQDEVIKQSDRFVDEFLCFLLNGAKMIVSLVFRLVATVDRNLDGWTCVEPVAGEEGEFNPFLQEFLRDKKNCIGGEEMIRRAKEQGALTGLRHAEAMLRQQERIPVEWRKYYLVFSEVWRSPDGYRRVWYFYWGGRRWYLHYRWLEYDFGSSGRLVASRK